MKTIEIEILKSKDFSHFADVDLSLMRETLIELRYEVFLQLCRKINTLKDRIS